MRRSLTLPALLEAISIALLFGLSVFSPTRAFAQSNLPDPVGIVGDFAEVLTDAQEAAIGEKVRALEGKTTDEIAVATVRTLEGVSVEAYAIALGNKWGVGKKGRDNGIVFLIAPSERKLRIEVGTGLQAKLTNAKAAHIVDRIVIPQFKRGQMAKGIVDGVDAIISAVNVESAVPPEPTTAVERSRVEVTPREMNQPAQMTSQFEAPGLGLESLFHAFMWVVGGVIVIAFVGQLISFVFKPRADLKVALAQLEEALKKTTASLKESEEVLMNAESDSDFDTSSLNSAKTSTRSVLTLSTAEFRNLRSKAKLISGRTAVIAATKDVRAARGKLLDARSILVSASKTIALQVSSKAEASSLLGGAGTLAALVQTCRDFFSANPLCNIDVITRFSEIEAMWDALSHAPFPVKTGEGWVSLANRANALKNIAGNWISRAKEEVELQDRAQREGPGLLNELSKKLEKADYDGSDEAQAELKKARAQLANAKARHRTGGGLSLLDWYVIYALLSSSKSHANKAASHYQSYQSEQQQASAKKSSSGGFGLGGSGGFGGGGFSGRSSGGASGGW